MSTGFTKLFGSILHSTIWTETAEIKVLWITMLAMCDQCGHVHASIPGLAKAAGVTLEQCETGLSKFLAPDKYSRTPDFEGRRIEPIDGGWLLLNFDKYREIASKEERTEKNKIYKQRSRDRKTETFTDNQQPCQHMSAVVSSGQQQSVVCQQRSAMSAQEDTDTDTDTDIDTAVSETAPIRQQQIQTSCAQKAAHELFETKKPKKEKLPKVPKVPKQLNGYNPVKIWLGQIGFFQKIQSPKVSGFEIKYLTELGNMYSEAEFRAMMKAYGEDHEGNGKPWRLFDEFYKCHAYWRGRARVGISPGSEEALAAILANADDSMENIHAIVDAHRKNGTPKSCD